MQNGNPTNWTQPLSRRSVLRGAGAVLALPFLESWSARQARAAGESVKVATKPPLRMGIFTVTGGTVIESWRQKAGGQLGQLPSILRSLEFARDELLLLNNLSHSAQNENLNGHEFCAFQHLTCAPKVGRAAGKVYAGVSVDQVAAMAAGAETYLPSLEMGMTNHETRYSFRSADEQVSYEPDPRLVFERMFRGRKPIIPNWQRRQSAQAAKTVRDSAGTDSYQRGVVDAVLDEAKTLRGRLGVNDRNKLDQYLSSVRSIESRIERMEARLQIEAADESDPGPSQLVSPVLPDKGTPFYKLQDLIYRDPEKHGEYIRLMSELMALAFQTDTTRVITLAAGDDGALFPGVVTVGYEHHCHTLEHQGNAGRPEDADPIAREACRQIHAWYTSLFAEFVKTLRSIDEGGSSLLDNTMLLYTSYMADGGHGTRECPALLVGKAGGTLRTGRQIDFQSDTPVANLYVEMLDRMNVKVDSFGNSQTSQNAAYDGRLPGLV